MVGTHLRKEVGVWYYGQYAFPGNTHDYICAFSTKSGCLRWFYSLKLFSPMVEIFPFTVTVNPT